MNDSKHKGLAVWCRWLNLQTQLTNPIQLIAVLLQEHFLCLNNPTSCKSLSSNFLLFHGTLASEDDPWAQQALFYFYPLLWRYTMGKFSPKKQWKSFLCDLILEISFDKHCEKNTLHPSSSNIWNLFGKELDALVAVFSSSKLAKIALQLLTRRTFRGLGTNSSARRGRSCLLLLKFVF